MKTQTEIENRIRSLLAEERDRRVAEARARLPHLCTHNHRQPLDTRRHVEDEPNESFNRITDRRGLPVIQTMGLCMKDAENPEHWNGTICEDPIDAQRCPFFDAKEDAASVEESFRNQMRDDTWVRANLPEIHALLWILDTSVMPSNPPPPVLVLEEECPPLVLSWWKRVLLRWVLGASVYKMRILPPPREE